METKHSKYILAGLTVLCVLLICITSLKDGIMEPLRTGVGYFLIPIQTGVNAVGTGIYNELKDYGSLKDALRENEELKTQIVQLTEDNNRLQAEQFELDRLRQLYELDQEYMQYKFRQQWMKLKAYAKEKGIQIIGDIPIYVAMDSADTWANPWLFKLDEKNCPTQVAGCPPDGFSATGQLWGNPLYNWEVHRNSGYEWWIKRIANCFRLYDVVRIDHFRGFDEYYAIPYGDATAENGWWEKGPGIDLFRAISASLGDREIIAEDLGYMTDSVKRLVEESGYPNMKVIEFAFDERDTGNASDYLPHNYPRNCVVYTGTHDNETLLSWLEDITPAERRQVRKYLNNFKDSGKELCNDLICLVMQSVANLCIVPMQDYLGLDNSARMNQPSTLGKNWKWRLKEGQFTAELQKEMLELATRYGRR